MLSNLDLMDIQKNDQIIFDDVIRLSAEITETNVANEFGAQYALYQLTITKMNGIGNDNG